MSQCVSHCVAVQGVVQGVVLQDVELARQVVVLLKEVCLKEVPEQVFAVMLLLLPMPLAVLLLLPMPMPGVELQV